MIEDHLICWKKLATPPPEAMKTITGGRLSGFTDIVPQWRYKIMTEVYGPCGIGWKFEIEKLWTEQGVDGGVMAHARVAVYTYTYRDAGDPEWSEPIPGVGSSMLIANEHAGLHANNEAFKMAVTDALGTALKMLGVASDVYEGRFESKYQQPEKPAHKPKPRKAAPPPDDGPPIEAYESPPTSWNKDGYVEPAPNEALQKLNPPQARQKFGTMVRLAREHAGMDRHVDLAREMGRDIKWADVKAWEQGDKMPDSDTLNTLIGALGLDDERARAMCDVYNQTVDADEIPF